VRLEAQGAIDSFPGRCRVQNRHKAFAPHLLHAGLEDACAEPLAPVRGGDQDHADPREPARIRKGRPRGDGLPAVAQQGEDLAVPDEEGPIIRKLVPAGCP
jgi:hypothetical protein